MPLLLLITYLQLLSFEHQKSLKTLIMIEPDKD